MPSALPPTPTTAVPAGRRFDAVDALRGLAIVWMTAYHFCFDLNHFGHIRQDFYTDPFWTWQRTAIVSLFLFTAGLGQAIATGQGQGWPRFWRRWAQVAGCAVLVTAGSYWMYPRSFIYFGVLHGMALMLLGTRLLAAWGERQPLRLWGLGGVLIATPFIASNILSMPTMAEFADAFNSRILNWIGWITRKPITEDYVPLMPWLGIMLWGLAAGQWLLRARPPWLARGVSGGGRALAFLGRWSLSYYMLHQPVLIGLLTLLAGR